MEKVLNIGGHEIKMKSTAGTITRYRNAFNRDFMKDLIHMQEKLTENQDAGVDNIDLSLFEKLAWAMAKTADDNVPELEKWLDQFAPFDIIQAIPDIMNLLIANLEQINNKKKLEEQPTNV